VNEDQVRAVTGDTPPEVLKERKDAATLARMQREADVKWLLNSPEGRRLALDLMAKTGALSLGYSPVHADMAYLQGRRSIGIEIAAEWQKTDPKGYLAMLTQLVNASVT